MHNIGRIIKLARPLHGLFFGLSLLILVASLLDLVTPLLSKLIVDQIVLQVQEKSGSIADLLLLIFLTFGVALIGLMLTTVSNRLGDHLAGRLRRFLTEKFYHKILTLPQSYYDSEISGKITSQLHRGIQTIQQFSNTMSNFILPTFLQSIFTIFILAYYSLPIAFFVFMLFPVYLYLSYISSKKWGEYEGQKNKIEDKFNGRIQEVINNIKLVKGFTNEKNEYDFVASNLRKSNQIYAKQSTTFHKIDFLRNLSLHIIITLVNIVAFYDTFQGVLTIGELVLILQLVNQARRPLFAMSFILTQVQMAERGAKEYLEILHLPSKEHFEEVVNAKRIDNPQITFKNVSFAYETSQSVLRDVSFTIGNNETVALVGHSGAGKSTIVNLILKFYEQTSGKIFLNNKEYSDLSHIFVRQNISLVFQENELFSSTIKENVFYGSDANDEEVIEALKKANAYDFVMKLPKGIESEVGERGVRLSGGQKQRVQIARAILKNAPILILDEATSSLDAKSEMEVQNALENLMKDKLVIIIAHRFSTIQNVNKILVLGDGAIIDSGTPQELAGRKGIYKDLLTYQVEGNKKLLESFELY